MQGMNPDFLGPTVHQVEVEVDWIEGWAPGDVALEALKAELRHWVVTGVEISLRVDPPIPLPQWRAAEDTFGAAAALVHANGDPTRAEGDVTQLHVAYLPTLRPVGMRAALGVAMALPHGPRPEDMRMTVLLGTDAIQKIAALWIGPRKVERTVMVHELGHVLGLVSDAEHQHRGDPNHCRNSSCLMVSSRSKGAAVVAAPRAIFLGRLPTTYCSVCRGDLAAAQELFAESAKDPVAWASLTAERASAARERRIAFLLQSGDVEAAVTELRSPDQEPNLGWLLTLARTLRGLGRWEQALEAGRRLGPLDAQARAVRVRADPLMDMGRWEEALQEIEDAKARGTYEWRLEMQALLGAGRVQEADGRLRLEVEKATDPRQKARILHERLWLWRAAGDPAHALELLAPVSRRGLRADPGLALEAGRALPAQGRTEEARELLDPFARKKKAGSGWYVTDIAHARALTGDSAGALRAIERTSEWFRPGDVSLLRSRIVAVLRSPRRLADCRRTLPPGGRTTRTPISSRRTRTCAVAQRTSA